MVSSKPCLDVALMRAVFPVPSIREEFLSTACTYLGVVSVFLLHLPPIDDTAVRRAEESLPSLSGICYKFLSALLAVRVFVLPWNNIVPAAIHSDGVLAESCYLRYP